MLILPALVTRDFCLRCSGLFEAGKTIWKIAEVKSSREYRSSACRELPAQVSAINSPLHQATIPQRGGSLSLHLLMLPAVLLCFCITNIFSHNFWHIRSTADTARVLLSGVALATEVTEALDGLRRECVCSCADLLLWGACRGSVWFLGCGRPCVRLS